MKLLRHKWNDAQESAAWERQPPDGGDFAKIIYDQAAAEVRVSGRVRGKNFATTIAV